MLEPELVIELNEKVLEQLRAVGLEGDDVVRAARSALAREMLRGHHLSIGLAAELAQVERAEFVAQVRAHGMALIDLPDDEMEREFALVDSMLGKGQSQ